MKQMRKFKVALDELDDVEVQADGFQVDSGCLVFYKNGVDHYTPAEPIMAYSEGSWYTVGEIPNELGPQ